MAETITQAVPYLVGAWIAIKLVEFGWRNPVFGFFLVLLVGSYVSVHVGAWLGITPGVVMLSAGGGVVAPVCGLALYGWWKGIR